MSKEQRWPLAQHSRAMRWGILLSLLLHVGLLRLFLLQAPPPVAAVQPALPDMTLLLLPAPQAQLPPAQQELHKLQASPRSARSAKADIPKKTAPQSRPLPLPPMTQKMNPAVVAAAPVTIYQPRLRIDLDSALKMAGKMAQDPAMRDDRAVAQLQNHPLAAANPDTRLGQAIQHSARADCLNSYSAAGLLAPLLLAADVVLSNKDRGCKW